MQEICHKFIQQGEDLMNIVFLGPPGSGKGTQADILCEQLGLAHVASGDLFRYNLNNDTELGKKARAYMERGDLVPDDITIAMVKDRLQQPDTAQGVILDGFPRTPPQAEALEAIFAELGTSLDKVVYLNVPDEEIVLRLSGRLICRKCQATFHKVYNPFTTCPHGECNGEYLYQREDDKPETVRARLKVYHEQTSPLVDYYRQKGMLVEVSGVGSIADITAALLEALGVETPPEKRSD